MDDNSFNLLTLEMVLREFCGGIKCDKALNGEEAVKMVSQNLLRASQNFNSGTLNRCQICGQVEASRRRSAPSYRLIFMDIQMPIMDGYEASRQINQLYTKWSQAQGITDHSLKIVAVTAFTNEEAIKNCFDAGMVQVLNKPVNQDQIREALHNFYFVPGEQISLPRSSNFPGGY